YAAPVDRDLAVERGGQAEDQSALQLGRDDIGIDGDAGIDSAVDAPQMDVAAGVDLCFDDGCDEAFERGLDADAAADAWWQFLAPAGFLGDEVERGAHAW